MANNAVCNTNKMLYNIFMKRTSSKFKVPDIIKDRKQIIEEAKEDLKNLTEERGAIGNIADLAKALKKAKKK